MWNEKSLAFLRNKQYLKGNETLEQRIDAICNAVRQYEKKGYPKGTADFLRENIMKQYITLSTPQLSNVGRSKDEGKKTVDLPCSCNIITVPNSIAGIYYSLGESAMLSKLGAGVGINYYHVYDGGTPLSEGISSNNKLDWAEDTLKLDHDDEEEQISYSFDRAAELEQMGGINFKIDRVEDAINAGKKVSQGTNRRGYVVPFDSIMSNHFDEKSNTGGGQSYLERLDKNNPNKYDPFTGNNMGFILPSGFRDKIIKGDEEARRRFLKLLVMRKNLGKFYLVDIDNLNKNKSIVYERLGHIVDSTNICTEAVTPSYDDMTFACMLLSINLVHWDHIEENPEIIENAFIVNDIMVQIYIDNTKGIPFLEKARKSAMVKRDIGVGALGFHEYLQSKMYAYGDINSRRINKEIFSKIRVIGENTTYILAKELGSAPMCAEATLIRRNVSLMMIAPNKSTAFLMNQTSEGIQPFVSNYFISSLAGIESICKNKHLEELLIKKGEDTHEVWESIIDNLGSVQHLDFLTQEEKDVFRTAQEISPKDIIDLAADRQAFIDMAQSLNLWNRPNYSIQDIYNIHMYAFNKGIKTLYYFYSQASASLERDGKNWDECVSCAD